MNDNDQVEAYQDLTAMVVARLWLVTHLLMEEPHLWMEEPLHSDGIVNWVLDLQQVACHLEAQVYKHFIQCPSYCMEVEHSQ